MLDVSIKEDNVNETQVVFVTLKGALDSEKAIDFYDFINILNGSSIFINKVNNKWIVFHFNSSIGYICYFIRRYN